MTNSPQKSEKAETCLPGLDAPSEAVPFDKIVSETKATLQETPKKRGRPPKAATTAGNVSTDTTTKSVSGFPSNGVTTAEQGLPGGTSLAPVMKSSGIPPDFIKFGLELPFAVAAATTGFAGFALAKEESEPLVPQADHLLALYLPNLGPNAPAYMFCFSVLGLGAVKYMAYTEWKKEKAEK